MKTGLRGQSKCAYHDKPLRASVAERLRHRSEETYRYLLALFRLSEYVAAIEPNAIPTDWDAVMREAPMPGNAGGDDETRPHD